MTMIFEGCSVSWIKSDELRTFVLAALLFFFFFVSLSFVLFFFVFCISMGEEDINNNK